MAPAMPVIANESASTGAAASWSRSPW